MKTIFFLKDEISSILLFFCWHKLIIKNNKKELIHFLNKIILILVY